MEFLFTLSVVHYMESIYIGKLHHLFSGSLLTDGHEEGGLIRSPAVHILPHAIVRAGQAHGHALTPGGGAHRPVVKGHGAFISISVQVIDTCKYK